MNKEILRKNIKQVIMQPCNANYPKRIKENGGVSFEPGFAPVGDGVLDFKAIVEAAKKSGTVHFLVEQDDAVNYPDPLGQVKRSIDYIKENL